MRPVVESGHLSIAGSRSGKRARLARGREISEIRARGYWLFGWPGRGLRKRERYTLGCDRSTHDPYLARRSLARFRSISVGPHRRAASPHRRHWGFAPVLCFTPGLVALVVSRHPERHHVTARVPYAGESSSSSSSTSHGGPACLDPTPLPSAWRTRSERTQTSREHPQAALACHNPFDSVIVSPPIFRSLYQQIFTYHQFSNTITGTR